MEHNFNEENNENTDGNNSSGDGKNSYAEQYEQQNQISALEENAPKLNNPIKRTIDKKAIAFMAIASLGVIGLMVFAFQQLQEPEEEPKTERAQVVSVPELPQEAPQSNGSAIPLANDSASEAGLERSQNANNILSSSNSNVIPVESGRQSMQPAQAIGVQPASMGDSGLRKNDASFVEDGNNGASEAKTTAAVRMLPNRDKLLLQGTYLRCVLETKIISDVPGFTSCIITEPVYSANGQYALIPKGSKVMGQYGSSNPVSPRLSVIWDRIVTPDGLDVTLRSPGVDNLGAAGHVGDFRTHWQSRLASALLISMISDVFKYAGAEYGPDSTTITDSATYTNPYESETADTLKQMAINQLERNNARPNTVTINQGTLINIYTAQDIDFGTVMQ